MKKRIVATLLTLCLVLGLAPVRALAAEQLPTPTDLKWGESFNGHESNFHSKPIIGYIGWKSEGTREDPCFEWKIFDDSNTSDAVYSLSHNFGCVSGYYAVDDFILADLDSGTYYFTVKAIGDGVDTLDSETVTSEKWTYVKPDTKLAKMETPSWDWPTATWTSIETSSLYGYQIEVFFSETESGEYSRIQSISGLYEDDIGVDLDESLLLAFNEGYFKFRIRALSNDITQYQHGPWSELSEAYHLESTTPPEPSKTELTTAMFTVDTTPETYDGSAKTKSVISSLVEGTDYTVSYANNTEIGTATITITGKGNYSGTVKYTFAIIPGNIEDTPQNMGNWSSYGNTSKKLNSINLSTENEKQQFVRFLLGADYLEEIDEAYKTQMYEKLYALLYTTNYRPDKLGGFKTEWPFLNNVKSGNNLPNSKTGIGDIRWYRSCQGCYAYANFANQFFFDQNNKDASAEQYTYYYHTFIGLNNASQLKQSDITSERVKAFIEEFASPGEQIRFYHNAKGALYSWTNMHSVLYLGENREKTGFYALSYLGSNSKSGLEINFYSYSDLATSVGLRGLDTLRVLGNFRDPSNQADYKNRYIHMDVHCPVEVTVTYETESLSSLDVEEATASFGTLKRDNDTIHLELIYHPNYDINIWGIGTGTMDLTLSYIGENEETDIRIFEKVPIKDTTNISVFSYAEENDTLLYLDPNSDGTEMEIWSAAENETVTELSTDKMFSEGFTTEKPTPEPDPTPSGGSSDGGSRTSYSITPPAQTTGGKVTVSPESASSGKNVTLTVTPDEGYQLGKLTVTDKKGKEIALTHKGDGTYTFTMPASQVEISASFLPLPPAETPEETVPVTELFSDVRTTDWFVDAVQFVCDNGIMDGVGEGRFAPQAVTTRGTIVTMLYRLEGEPPAGQPGFSDVGRDLWYAKGVAWCADKGIVNGFEDGTFRPDAPVTREQLAVILFRYASYKGYDVSEQAELGGFEDVQQVGQYALLPMAWAVRMRIITGTDSLHLTPQGEATRAEVAAVLARFCQTFTH